MSTTWNRTDHIVLFDVDGTLTESRQLILPEMENLLLKDLKDKVTVGLVSGSDLVKLAEQMGGDDVIHKFDYVFPENGLVAYKEGKLIDKMDIAKHMGEEKLQTFINFCLRYMAGIKYIFKTCPRIGKFLKILGIFSFNEVIILIFFLNCRFKFTC